MNVMTHAWHIARTLSAEFGGNAKDILPGCLRIAHKTIRDNAMRTKILAVLCSKNAHMINQDTLHRLELAYKKLGGEIMDKYVTLHQQWLDTKTPLSFFEQLESDRLDHEEYIVRNELPGFEYISNAQSDYPWDGTTDYSDDIPF